MTNLAIITNLLSTIISVIKTVEAHSADAKAAGQEVWTGQFKLQLGLTIIEDVYNATNPPIPFSTVKDTLTATVNGIVAVYNAIGLFKKTA